MILVFIVGIALVVRLLSCGSIRGVEELRIRGESLLLAVFALTFGLPFAARALLPSRPFVFPAWIALMTVLLVVSLANVSRSHGFRVIASGVALNLAVIALNGAMPVRIESAVSIGSTAGLQAASAGDVFHSVASSATRLSLLADVLPLPGFRGLRSVNSIGDLLMYVGMVIVVVSASASGTKRRSQRG